MRSILRRLPLLSLILVLAAPAQSLDFSTDVVLYEEDFEGETSFPTTPEVDAIAAGGMSGILFPSFGSPTLSGTAISASVSISGDSLVISTIGPNSIGTDSSNLRGEFSGLSATTDANLDVLSGASFDSGEVDTGGILVVLRVDNSVNFEAVLIVAERDGSLPTGVFNNSLEVSVPSGAFSALLAGAAFVLDCQIDRAAERVTGSIDIDGFPPIIVGPMSLTVLSPTDPLIQGTGLVLAIDAGTLVEIEFDSFRVSQSAAMVPALSPVSLALLAAALLGAAWHRSHNRSYGTHGSTTSSV